MEKALQLVFSLQAREVAAEAQAFKAPTLRPSLVETPITTTDAEPSTGERSSNRNTVDGTNASKIVPSAAVSNAKAGLPYTLQRSDVSVPSTTAALGPAYESNKSQKASSLTPPPAASSTLLATPSGCASSAPSRLAPVTVISPQNSPSVLLAGPIRRIKTTMSPVGTVPPFTDPAVPTNTPIAAAASAATASIAWSGGPLLRASGETSADGKPTASTATTVPGVSDGCESANSSTESDGDRGKILLSDSGESKEEKTSFFKAKPRTGQFTGLIDWLIRCGERGVVEMPSAKASAVGDETTTEVFHEDYIMKLCAAATKVLVKEPTLLELEVPSSDTMVVVGDIHGQFQDLYTSVLCQQYDRHRCNHEGMDRRFLFMGDYVDRGPHSLEVVLLLLALKVEYPSLVYLTRGNHEEEKTSRVYGFLTEATSVLGRDVGAAVWSAVNKVFLDLPLAAIVTTPRFRFLVMHGGLSPALQTTDQIAVIDRHAYNTGELSKEAHDIVDGLLWSDPSIGIGCFSSSPRGCGWSFGQASSVNFCTKNRLNFICRAHQLAMDGYFWTHNDRVVTVFSAPNYCGINDNRGAVMVVSGSANKPSFDQYDYYEDEMDCGRGPTEDFPYSTYFA